MFVVGIVIDIVAFTGFFHCLSLFHFRLHQFFRFTLLVYLLFVALFFCLLFRFLFNGKFFLLAFHLQGFLLTFFFDVFFSLFSSLLFSFLSFLLIVFEFELFFSPFLYIRVLFFNTSVFVFFCDCQYVFGKVFPFFMNLLFNFIQVFFQFGLFWRRHHRLIKSHIIIGMPCFFEFIVASLLFFFRLALFTSTLPDIGRRNGQTHLMD